MKREQAYWENYRPAQPPPDPKKPLLKELLEIWSLAGQVTRCPARFGLGELPNFNTRAWLAYAVLALVVWASIIALFITVLGTQITMAILGLMAITIAGVYVIQSKDR